MTQSKGKSLFESCCNVGSGFLIAYLSWVFIIPRIFNMDTIGDQGFLVTCYFTTISVVRGYIWRRFFNKQENKSEGIDECQTGCACSCVQNEQSGDRCKDQ